MVLFFIFYLSERSEAQSERHFGDIICLLREFLLRSSICWNFAGMDLFFIILAQFYALKSSKRTSFFKKTNIVLCFSNLCKGIHKNTDPKQK